MCSGAGQQSSRSLSAISNGARPTLMGPDRQRDRQTRIYARTPPPMSSTAAGRRHPGGQGGADSFVFTTALGRRHVDTIGDFTPVDRRRSRSAARCSPGWGPPARWGRRSVRHRHRRGRGRRRPHDLRQRQRERCGSTPTATAPARRSSSPRVAGQSGPDGERLRRDLKGLASAAPGRTGNETAVHPLCTQPRICGKYRIGTGTSANPGESHRHCKDLSRTGTKGHLNGLSARQKSERRHRRAAGGDLYRGWRVPTR